MEEKALRKIIEEELKKNLTKKEFEEVLKSYPTRAEFWLELEKLERKIDDKAQVYHDSLMNKLDYIVGELEDSREERIFAQKKDEDLQEQIYSHDKRITILEHA